MKYIYLSGDVSSWDYDGCINASRTRHAIADARAEDPSAEITAILNSYGGDVTEGIAVYNLLRASRPLNIVISGIAASIASVIAMAGDRVSMYSNSTLFIHHAWTWADGNAADMKQRLEELEAADRVLIDAYMRKTGRTEDEIRAVMDGPNGDGSSIDADRALELGLIDEILDPATAVAALLKSSTRQHSNRAGTQPGATKEPAMSAELANPPTPAPSAACGDDQGKNAVTTDPVTEPVTGEEDMDEESEIEKLKKELEEMKSQLAAANQQVAAAARFRSVNAAAGQLVAQTETTFPEAVKKHGFAKAAALYPELRTAYMKAERAKGNLR